VNIGGGELTHDMRIKVDANHSIQSSVNLCHHRLRDLGDRVRPYASLQQLADRTQCSMLENILGSKPAAAWDHLSLAWRKN
jgi:hypothetical protein